VADQSPTTVVTLRLFETPTTTLVTARREGFGMNHHTHLVHLPHVGVLPHVDVWHVYCDQCSWLASESDRWKADKAAREHERVSA
jgi:hypothetical protein